MSDEEKYIAGQKACGIEVGDTVRITRMWKQGERGSDCTPCCLHEVGKESIVEKLWSDGDIEMKHWFAPHFVLEIVKKKDGRASVKEPCVCCKHLDTDICAECPTYDGSCTCHTGNPPCGCCEGSLWEEETQESISTRVLVDKFADITNTSRKERNMSTQEQKVFDVTVVERTEVLHEGSGIVQKINRTVLFDAKISAVSDEAAKQKALVSCKATNFDNLEITCRPF